MANKQKILIVDDDENIANLISLYLTKECYETRIEHDGQSALDAFKEYAPNLILLDIMLPGLDGYEVCREIRRESKVPIIMLSAKTEVFDKVLGLELGADDYIIKPFDLSVLRVRLRNILQNRQHLRDTVLSSDIPANEVDYSSQLDKEFLDNAMAAIDANMGNLEFSITDFCRTLGMSRTSVYNKIRHQASHQKPIFLFWCGNISIALQSIAKPLEQSSQKSKI